MTFGKLGDRLKIPDEMLLRLSDLDNPYSVPFYDGAVSVSHYANAVNVTLGEAGTLSGDLRKLQISLKAKGFDPENLMNVSGEFDEATAVAIQKMADALSTAGFSGYGTPGKSGALGDYTSNTKFNIKTVVAYNMYVTYGTSSNAVKAGKSAIAVAAVQAGLPYNFVAGVASQESGFYPCNESMDFAGGTKMAQTSWNVPIVTSGPGKNSPPLIEYKGEKRVVRRAQGLMQLTIGTGLGLCAKHGVTDIEQAVAMIRTPASNAMLGAEYLRDNILAIEKDESLYSWVKATAAQSNWSGLGKATGHEPIKLLEYAMSAIMYNMGSGNLNSQLNKLSSMTYTVSNGKYTCDTNGAGYSAGVLNYIFSNAN